MKRLWLKIGEVSVRIGVKPKELRYWERVIPELRVRRSKGNLRYYHVDDLERLIKIRNWLREGFTVADCRKILLTGKLADQPNTDWCPSIEDISIQSVSEDTTVLNKHFDVTEIVLALKRILARLNKSVR